MKVALFAPYLTSDQGGVWNFYQWVVQHPAVDSKLLYLGPGKLLEEAGIISSSPDNVMAMESLIESVRASGLNYVLGRYADGDSHGIKIPLYNSFMSRVVKFCLRKSVEREVVRAIKTEDIDVIHIPFQRVPMRGLVNKYPYVINPHDYQHEYFPEFFTEDEINKRRRFWYRDQRGAAAVVVHSRQTRSDAIRFLGIPEERVFYAPYGPIDNFPICDAECMEQVSRILRLPERFIFYPAMSWPHKNHLTLLKAVKQLKRRGIAINIVFTCIEGEHGDMIRQFINTEKLTEQVIITGRVDGIQMAALYKLCSMVVVPSLFEQNSGPVLEAIHFGKAVAVSAIEEVVSTLDGAGLLFDPNSTGEIASAIDSLWSSQQTVKAVESAICVRRDEMSWEPFQEIYRQAYYYAGQQNA